MAVAYVDFDRATDGNGTVGTPWNNPISAEAGSAPGDTLFARGTFRGQWNMNAAKGGANAAAKTRWIGAANDPWVVTGGEKLTGFVRCNSGDQVDIGANFASIHKVTISKSSLPNSDPYSANICENTAQLPIACSRAVTTDRFNLNYAQDYWTASSVTLSGALITQFRLPAVTDLFTQAQLERSRLAFVKLGNLPEVSAITYDTGTKFMTLVTPANYHTSSQKDNFALLNLLPALKRGEWGFKDNGTTVTIYVWPQSETSLASGIEYSARATCLNTNGTSNIEMAYFEVRQAASSSSAEGNLINATLDCSDVTLHHFRSRDMLNTNNAEALCYMRNVQNLNMYSFDLLRGQGCFGLTIKGNGASNAQGASPNLALVNLMKGGFIRNFTASYCSSAPVRMFTIANTVIAFGTYWECAKQNHGNTMNCYEQCTNNLWWGCDGEDSGGYYTIQESDSIVIAFCSASASRAPNGGARGIFHQQGSTGTQGQLFGFKGSAVINCRSVPYSLQLAANNALRWGAQGVPLDKIKFVSNNVVHGYAGETAGDFATIDAGGWDNNIYTVGTSIVGAADEAIPATDIYVSPANDNYKYTPGSRVRTKAARNMSAFIDTLKLRWPQFTEWDKDMVGDAINWAGFVGCGPTVNKDAVYGKARGITQSGLTTSSGGGGTSTRPTFAPGFKIKVV